MVREIILHIIFVNCMQAIIFYNFFYIQCVTVYSFVIITKGIAKIHAVLQCQDSISYNISRGEQ